MILTFVKVKWRRFTKFLSNPVENGQKAVQKWLNRVQEGLGDIWGWVRGKWRKGWANFRDWITDPIAKGRKAAGKWLDRIRTHLGNIWSYARDKWRKGWAKIKEWATDPIADARKAINTWLERIRKNISGIHQWARDTWRNNWKNITKWFAKPMQDARDAFSKLLGRGGSIRNIFTNGVKAIGDIWGGIRKAAATPVNFVIDWVYNKGIRKVIGAIPGVKTPPAVKRLRGWSEGGYTGAGSKMQPAGIVHADEFVVRKDSRRKIEKRAPGFLNALNNHGDVALKAFGFYTGGLVNRLRGYAKGGSVWPTVGRRTGTYPGHDGVDINQPPGPDFGAPIFAWRSGKITYTGWGRGYGHAIFEKAAGYPEVVYGHASAVRVGSGANVKAGQVIGNVGATGNAQGAHLHFGVPNGSYGQAMGLLSGAGKAAGGGGGGGGIGQWVTDIVKHLNPLRFLKLDDWASKLGNQGAWGGMMGTAVKSVMPAFKGWAADKIKDAFAGAKGILSGGKFFTTESKHLVGGGPGKSSPGSSKGLVPIMARARQFVMDTFGVNDIGGFARSGHMPGSKHYVGKAIDVMTYANKALGQRIADYFATGPGHRRFNVENTIFNHRIHNQRGWHAYGERGNATLNHEDHVHVDTWDKGGPLYPGSTLAINGTGKTETVFTNDNMVSLGRDLQNASATLRSLIDPAKRGNVGTAALVENLTITGRPNDVPDMLRDATHQLRVIRQGGVYAKSAT